MAAVNITYLPLSNPLCDNDTCLAFETAHEASQSAISWASQFEYGKWVTYYYCGFIGIFAIIYLFRLSKDRFVPLSPQNHRTTPNLWDKLIATGRSLSYRCLRGRIGNHLALPSLGLSACILLAILFSVLITFIQRPYYRERRDFGSPPLGVRAGMAGTALTPLVFALAGKYNLVTLLTGISHEKLNVLHRWVSYIYLFFGIVHTVAFLVADLSGGGAKKLHYQFTYPGSMEYTGIAPFVVLVFLCAASAYWLRRKFYWIFAKAHILASIAYLGTMFWHCENTLDSWYYLWGALAVMILQWGIRAFHKTTIFELSGKNGGWERAGELHLEVLDSDMARLTMYVAMRWTPGQHVFLRIPEFGMLANHPFTISSVCNDAEQPTDPLSDKLNKITFLVRPYRGLTRRLINHNGPAPYAMLDGPYGGIPRPLHMVYDNIVLVGGGGGISALLPWLIDLSTRIAQGADAVRTTHLSLLWCVRDRRAISWVETELRACRARLPSAESLSMLIFVTGDNDDGVDTEGAHGAASPTSQPFIRDEKAPDSSTTAAVEADKISPSLPLHDAKSEKVSTSSTPHPLPFTILAQRPFLPDILAPRIRPGRSLYIGCGPQGMKTDLSNFAASAQREVLSGSKGRREGRGPGCVEIALHTETFDW